jgi:UTP--glucose-1-phosphate uridylyltransferase
MTNLTIDDATRAALAPYGFDEATLARFARRVGDTASNAVKGTLTPPAPEDVVALPPLGSGERRRLRARGLELLRQRKVGVVILAGGMATRFGGVVKAVVPVLGDRSFLQIKHDDLAALAQELGAPIPTYVMSSFATHDRIRAHLDEKGIKGVEVFSQLVSVRLTPEGAVFQNNDGTTSAYATGHGDLTFALRASGVLRRFREAGGTTLYMSNVDNLGATLDPAMVALHDELGAKITAEVVRKEKGDKGGAPARLDGVPQIVEGFRFPKSFDQDSIPVFNTNTFILDAAAIDRDFDLPFYRVEKSVEGRTAIQFERLVGELTAFLPSRFVEVPRTGEDGRFLPAKDPEELQRRLDDIALVARSTRSLRD